MSKIKSVACGCAEENLVRKTAEQHPETCIVMCRKCGHRYLVGNTKEEIARAKRSKFADEDYND